MRARWVSQRPSPKLPIIGQTHIASFWPGKYYFVSTIKLDQDSPLSKLTRSLELNVAFNDVPLGPDEFITQVFSCNKYMIPKSFDNPLFEIKHPTLSQAQIWHDFAVEIISAGKIKLLSQFSQERDPDLLKKLKRKS
jgi:hypothetical protein